MNKAKVHDNYGVMLHHGRKYAVGLMWLTAGNEDSKKLVRDRSAKANADFYCVRNGAALQHGMGWLSKGHRINQAAAAAMVADILVGDWHGVFKADNGWWYVKVHSDVIAPNGDIFFLSEEEAYNHFRANHEGRVWAHAYAPAEWDVANISKNLTLDEILDNIPSTRLVAANFTAQFGGENNKNIAVALFLGVIVIALGAILGPSLINILFPDTPKPVVVAVKPVADPKPGAVKTQAVQLPESLKALPTLEAPDPTIFKTAKPSSFVLACGETAAKLVMPIPGWKFSGISCADKTVIAQWAENKGTINTVRENVAEVLKKGASLNLNKGVLSMTLPMPALPELEQKNFLNAPSAILQLESRFLNIGGLTVDPVEPPPPPPPTEYQRKNGIIPKAELPYLKVKVTANMSPKVLGNYFDMKGLQLQSIEWSFPQQLWTYNAKMMISKETEKKPSVDAAAVPAAVPAPVPAPAPYPVNNNGK